MIVPSTMMSGSVWPVMLAGERRRIAGAAPGWPDTVTTLAPATLPLRLAIAETPGASFSAVASTTATENAVFFCDVASLTPVTTICSRLSTSRSRSKSLSTRASPSRSEKRLGL